MAAYTEAVALYRIHFSLYNIIASVIFSALFAGSSPTVVDLTLTHNYPEELLGLKRLAP